MKASELIKELEKAIKKYDDLDIKMGYRDQSAEYVTLTKWYQQYGDEKPIEHKNIYIGSY